MSSDVGKEYFLEFIAYAIRVTYEKREFLRNNNKEEDWRSHNPLYWVEVKGPILGLLVECSEEVEINDGDEFQYEYYFKVIYQTSDGHKVQLKLSYNYWWSIDIDPIADIADDPDHDYLYMIDEIEKIKLGSCEILST